MISFYSSILNKFSTLLAKCSSSLVNYSYFPKLDLYQGLSSKQTNDYPFDDSLHDSNIINISQCSFEPNISYVNKILGFMNHNKFYPYSKSSRWDLLVSLFNKKIRVIPLDLLQHKELIIQKQELYERKLDDVLLTKAKQTRIPLATHECQFILNYMDSTRVKFESFFVNSRLLCEESIESKSNIYYVNPLLIFSNLNMMFPNLSDYTVIFQDKHKHAIAHYRYGAIDFCAIIEKQIPLQNYYRNIDSIGEVIVCNLTSQSFTTSKSPTIESILSYVIKSNWHTSKDIEHYLEKFNISECFRILMINYFYSTNTSFLHEMLIIPKRFYIMQRRIIVYGSIGILAVLLSSAYNLYLHYQQKLTIQKELTNYYKIIDDEYHKKKNYTSVYSKIYDSINNNKSLNFSIEQYYNSQLRQWEDSKQNQQSNQIRASLN